MKSCLKAYVDGILDDHIMCIFFSYTAPGGESFSAFSQLHMWTYVEQWAANYSAWGQLRV